MVVLDGDGDDDDGGDGIVRLPDPERVLVAEHVDPYRRYGHDAWSFVDVHCRHSLGD